MNPERVLFIRFKNEETTLLWNNNVPFQIMDSYFMVRILFDNSSYESHVLDCSMGNEFFKYPSGATIPFAQNGVRRTSECLINFACSKKEYSGKVSKQWLVQRIQMELIIRDRQRSTGRCKTVEREQGLLSDFPFFDTTSQISMRDLSSGYRTPFCFSQPKIQP